MLLRDGSVRSSSALVAEGVRPQAIADALTVGTVVRVARGAYRLARSPVDDHADHLAAAAMRMSRAVACLRTAAFLNRLLDDEPGEIWFALPQGVNGAKADGKPLRLMRWSYSGAFVVGLTTISVRGVPVRTTGPERTILDLIRYGGRVGGLALAVACLRRHVRGGGRPAELTALADEVRFPAVHRRSLGILLEGL